MGFTDTPDANEFILEEHWDEQKDGPKPSEPAKMHMVGGAWRKGWWKEAERKGRWTRLMKINNYTEERHAITDNSGALGDERLANMKTAAQNCYGSIQKSVEANAVANATPTLASLMAIVSNFAQPSPSEPTKSLEAALGAETPPALPVAPAAPVAETMTTVEGSESEDSDAESNVDA